jgi:ketopantoate hydroxymethyltransferase
MSVREPVEPLFRAGAMALGYDAGRDRVLLVVQEAVGEEEERDPREVRFYASRAQMQALSAYARDIVARGRSPEQRALQVEAHSRRNGHGE